MTTGGGFPHYPPRLGVQPGSFGSRARLGQEHFPTRCRVEPDTPKPRARLGPGKTGKTVFQPPQENRFSRHRINCRNCREICQFFGFPLFQTPFLENRENRFPLFHAPILDRRVVGKPPGRRRIRKVRRRVVIDAGALFVLSFPIPWEHGNGFDDISEIGRNMKPGKVMLEGQSRRCAVWHASRCVLLGLFQSLMLPQPRPCLFLFLAGRKGRKGLKERKGQGDG